MLNPIYVVSETKFNNFLISWKNHVPFLRYSACYNLKRFIDFKNWDVMMSISFQGDFFGTSFERKLLKLVQLIDIVMGNIIGKN